MKRRGALTPLIFTSAIAVSSFLPSLARGSGASDFVDLLSVDWANIVAEQNVKTKTASKSARRLDFIGFLRAKVWFNSPRQCSGFAALYSFRTVQIQPVIVQSCSFQ